MFCSNCAYCLQESFSYCPKCGNAVNSRKNTKKHAVVGTASALRSSNAASGGQTVVEIGKITQKSGSSPVNAGPVTSTPSAHAIPNFSTFMKEKEADRQAHFQPKRKKSRSSSATVKDESVFINIGLMEYEAGEPKRVYGKSFPVKVLKGMNYDEVREKSISKWEDYDSKFSRERGYVLVYPDSRIAHTIPGASEEFTVQKYKEGLGKPYSRITLYLCPALPPKETESLSEPPITDFMHSVDNDNCEVDSEGFNEGDTCTWSCERDVELEEPVGDDLESFVIEDFV